MNMPVFRVVAVPLVLILLQAGCATDRPAQGAAKGPVVQELVKTTKSWDGHLLPPYPQGQPEVTIRKITIPPGVRLEPHEHPVINAGVLLSGELTVVTKEGKTLNLRAGDAIAEVVSTMHYGANRGRVPAEILVVYAGVVGTPINVSEKR